MSVDELNNLRNKEELYVAATAWVRVKCTALSPLLSYPVR